MTKFLKLAMTAAAMVTACSAAPAFAGTSGGTIGVSINISNACVVNGAAAPQASVGLLGNIQFPDQPGIFGNVDGELVGSLGVLQILCSPGVQPALTIGSGAHDASGRRYLASSNNNLAYRLYSDSQRTSEVTIGQQLSLGTATTSPISVPIYARVNSNGSVLPAGAYSDTVQVTLSW